MTKKKRKKYSRLNPAYLASRHAGALFMFLALGLLAGVAWRSLAQPTRYAARAQVAVTLTPPEAAESFDWEAKQNEWRGWQQTRRDRGLLSANLRFAVKLAATQDALIDTELLAETLAGFNSRENFSALLLPNRFLASLGPVLGVARRDLASHMDFQSLAAIIADLDPPSENLAWDFSSFHANTPGLIGSGIIAKPGPDDPFFQVFYRLHESLYGQPPDSPLAAWRTASDELAARLDREAEFAGGGGFGLVAKREILREIMAIPAIAANGLYQVNDWFQTDDAPDAADWAAQWDRDASVEVRRVSGTEGLAAVSVTTRLNPLAYRRDTVYTRLPPLAAATLIGFLAAREDKGAPTTLEGEEADRAPAPAPAAPADFVAELEPLEAAAEGTDAGGKAYTEVVDEDAAKARLAAIATSEETVNAARIQRSAALLRLNAARDTENRLSREAVAARARADRLQERHDAAMIAAEADGTPKPPPETARLFSQRDDAFARLTTLLQYCTEEHPFVRQARRELDALEAQLSGHTPDEEANRAAEARATRAAGLLLEWETAAEQADALEERLRRQNDYTAGLLNEATELERCISQYERDLALVRESPIPMKRQEVPQPPVSVRPAPTAPAPIVKPKPIAVPGAHLVFAPTPAHIPLETTPPDWRALPWGLAAGLCLGLLWILLRELFANHFRNAAEARRLIRLPVLASLPAYDMRSFRNAASALKGEIVRTPAGKHHFIPAMVEYSEPPPEARRGKILPAARRPRFLAWLFFLLFLILAGLLFYRSRTGFAQPRLPGGAAELSLPGQTIPLWAEGERQAWGNLP